MTQKLVIQKLVKPMFYLFLIAILLLDVGCEKSSPVEFVNKYDPTSKYFIGNSPNGITVSTINRERVKVSWNNNSDYIDGFIIEKFDSLNNRVTQFFRNRTNNYILQDSMDIFNKYKYRIRTKTQSNLSTFSDSIKIKYEPYELTTTNSTFQYFDYNFSNDLRRAFKFEENSIYIYEVEDIHNIPNSLKLIGQIYGMYHASFSKDGNYIVASSGERLLYYNVTLAKLTELRRSSVITSNYAVISGDNKTIMNIKTGIDGSFFEKWDLSNNQSSLVPLSTYPYRVTKMFISPDDRFLICQFSNEFTEYSPYPSYIEFYELNSMKRYAVINGKINSYTFKNDGKLFVYKDYYSQKIYFWDINSKTTVDEWDTTISTYPTTFNFVLNDEFLIDYTNPRIRMWKMKNLKPVGIVWDYVFPFFHLESMRFFIREDGDVTYCTGNQIMFFDFKNYWKIIR